MYGQRRGGKSNAPGKQVFFLAILLQLQLLYEICQEIRRQDRIQSIFLHQKTYNCGNRTYSRVH